MQCVEIIIIILILRQSINLILVSWLRWYMLNNKQILILEAATVGILNVGYVVYKIRQSQTNKYLFLYTAYMCSWLSRKLPV